MENKSKLIDLDGIINARNPQLYKKLPRFVVRRLERIIRQDEINRLLALYGHLDGVEFIDAVFDDLKVGVECHGLEDIGVGGKKVFVSNHPLGGLDGLAVISTVNKHFGKARGIVNDLLLNIGCLKSVFCGVNVYGHNTHEVVRDIDALYSGQENVCVFPAGLVSRRVDGQVQDLQWKKTFVEKAYANGLPIVPVYVDALNSNLFYSVANWRKRAGVKFNYELVMLPSELFKFAGKGIGLYFGKPVTPDELSAFKSPQERTLRVRELTYGLGTNTKTTSR